MQSKSSQRYVTRPVTILQYFQFDFMLDRRIKIVKIDFNISNSKSLSLKANFKSWFKQGSDYHVNLKEFLKGE